MSAWSIQAILNARKFQTRRPLAGDTARPLGHVGDFLYVRETFKLDTFSRPRYRAAMRPGEPGPWKSSRFMPGKFARVWLELVEEPRVEHLQAISAEDAVAEGIELPWDHRTLWGLQEQHAALDSFRELWDSIYARNGQGWETNPRVLRYAFRAHTAKGIIHVGELLARSATTAEQSKPATPPAEDGPGESGGPSTGDVRPASE